MTELENIIVTLSRSSTRFVRCICNTAARPEKSCSAPTWHCKPLSRRCGNCTKQSTAFGRRSRHEQTWQLLRDGARHRTDFVRQKMRGIEMTTNIDDTLSSLPDDAFASDRPDNELTAEMLNAAELVAPLKRAA